MTNQLTDLLDRIDALRKEMDSLAKVPGEAACAKYRDTQEAMQDLLFENLDALRTALSHPTESEGAGWRDGGDGRLAAQADKIIAELTPDERSEMIGHVYGGNRAEVIEGLRVKGILYSMDRMTALGGLVIMRMDQLAADEPCMAPAPPMGEDG